MSLLVRSQKKVQRRNQWPINRRYDELACDCDNCAKANDICSSCMDWSREVQLYLKCGHCSNVYHKHCLDDDELEPLSWYECNELGPDYECHQGQVIRFKWLKQKYVHNIKNERKYLKKRYGKEWDLNHAVTFYESFLLNNIKYKINDFVQFPAINDDDEEIIAIGQIVNIYLSQYNEALMVIEYFWNIHEHKVLIDEYGKDNDYYLFEDGSPGWYIMHDIEIVTIMGKIKICGSVNECIEWRTKIENNQRKIKKAMKRNECINQFNQRCPEINAYFLFNGSFNSKTGIIEEIVAETKKVKVKKEKFEKKKVIKKEIKFEYDDDDDSDSSFHGFSSDQNRHRMINERTKHQQQSQPHFDVNYDEKEIEGKTFIKTQKFETNTNGLNQTSYFDDEYLSGFSDNMASSDENLPTSESDENEESEFLNIEHFVPKMDKINVKEQKEEILVKGMKEKSDSFEISDDDKDYQLINDLQMNYLKNKKRMTENNMLIESDEFELVDIKHSKDINNIDDISSDESDDKYLFHPESQQSANNHNKGKTWQHLKRNNYISSDESDDDYGHDFIHHKNKYQCKNSTNILKKRPLKSALRTSSNQNDGTSSPKKVRFKFDSVEEEDYDNEDLKEILKKLNNKISEQNGNIKIHQNKINEQRERTSTTKEQYILSKGELKNKKQELNEWNECEELLLEMVKNANDAELEKKRKEMDDERNLNNNLNGEVKTNQLFIGRGNICALLQKWQA